MSSEIVARRRKNVVWRQRNAAMRPVGVVAKVDLRQLIDAKSTRRDATRPLARRQVPAAGPHALDKPQQPSPEYASGEGGIFYREAC